MKITFLDEDQDSKEYETEGRDLEKIIQIADNLSDSELEKIKRAIDKFQQLLPE